LGTFWNVDSRQESVQRLLTFDKGNSTRSLLVFDKALAELQAQKVAEGPLPIANCQLRQE